MALREDLFAETTTRTTAAGEAGQRGRPGGGRGRAAGEARRKSFSSLRRILLCSQELCTLIAFQIANYLLSLLPKWNRSEPSLFGNLLSKVYIVPWKVKRLGFIAWGCGITQDGWCHLNDEKHSHLWWCLLHTWLFQNVSQVSVQFPAQKSLNKGEAEEIIYYHHNQKGRKESPDHHNPPPLRTAAQPLAAWETVF